MLDQNLVKWALMGIGDLVITEPQRVGKRFRGSGVQGAQGARAQGAQLELVLYNWLVEDVLWLVWSTRRLPMHYLMQFATTSSWF